MHINPIQERHFNRFVLRSLAGSLLALLGAIGVVAAFWALRHVIPPGLSIALCAVGVMTWLFGARTVMDEVIPSIDQLMEQATEEELRRVLATQPEGADLHTLALAMLRKRGQSA